MEVEKRRKSSYFKPRQQFVSELGRILARIGDEDLELLSCASVGHGIPGSRPESRKYEIGHMCWSSATADLIGTALDQTILPLCPPKADLRLDFGWYASQFRVAWDGIAAWQQSTAHKRCSLILASSTRSSAMKQRLRRSS